MGSPCKHLLNGCSGVRAKRLVGMGQVEHGEEECCRKREQHGGGRECTCEDQGRVKVEPETQLIQSITISSLASFRAGGVGLACGPRDLERVQEARLRGHQGWASLCWCAVQCSVGHVLQRRLVGEGGCSKEMKRAQQEVCARRARLSRVPGNLGSSLLFGGCDCFEKLPTLPFTISFTIKDCYSSFYWKCMCVLIAFTGVQREETRFY